MCWCTQRVGKVARAAGVARRRRRAAVILGSNMVFIRKMTKILIKTRTKIKIELSETQLLLFIKGINRKIGAAGWLF